MSIGDGDVLQYWQEIVLSVTRPSISKVSLYTLTWSQNGIQQSCNIRQPIGIATSRVAQLRQLFFIYGFGNT